MGNISLNPSAYCGTFCWALSLATRSGGQLGRSSGEFHDVAGETLRSPTAFCPSI